MTAFAAMMPASQPNPSPSRPHEERVLRVRVTGFPRRVVAALCDLALLFALTLAVTATVAIGLHVPVPGLREIGPDLLVAGILDRNPMAVGAVGLLLGMAGLYQLYFAGVTGQTLGMKLVGIRLIDRRGRPPGPARGLLRLVALAPSVGPAALGWLWALFDREHRALHDHLAGTYVIVDED
ncbi:MAG TPA: RDD family protein [Polyangia bacterium]|nr:RDD family protein [Polyangia bacterium]